MIKLLIAEVTDKFSQENFKRLIGYFKTQEFMKGEWRFVEITLNSAVTEYKYPHRIGFMPMDVVQTRLTPAGVTLTWNYSKFDTEYINISTSAACVVRAFIGRYSEESKA